MNKVGPDEVLKFGGMGFKASLVAMGEADGYMCVETRAKKWDMCPGHALVKAAGGNVVNFAGGEFSYDFQSGNVVEIAVRDS